MESDRPNGHINHVFDTIEAINRGIEEAGLVDHDVLLAIESEVWSEVFEPSIGIWRTEEEANREYQNWREIHTIPRLFNT